VIRLHAVTKTYQTGDEMVRALGTVDLLIAPGEAVAVVGPSGAGKSTLLSILGLLDRPTSGQYYLGETETGSLPEFERAVLRREHIGFVFQRFNLVEELNISQNVGLPLVYRGWSAAERRKAVDEILERVGLAAKSRARPSQLSGGQQQRVALARAVVGRPSIVLCDEPTGNLDSRTGEQILELLLALHRETPDRILVIVTHNLDVARQLDRVLVIQDGQIRRDGPAEEVLRP
jgi:putative ABC transport system ATP-binding protein